MQCPSDGLQPLLEQVWKQELVVLRQSAAGHHQCTDQQSMPAPTYGKAVGNLWGPCLSQMMPGQQDQHSVMGGTACFPAAQLGIPADYYKMHSPASTVAVSPVPTPPASVAAPVVPVQVRQLAPKAEETSGSAVQAADEQMQSQYVPEKGHTARPFRRFTRICVPRQTDGAMGGTVPREGQSLPKSIKEDVRGAKARTLELEETAVTDVQQQQQQQQQQPQQQPQALSPPCVTALA